MLHQPAGRPGEAPWSIAEIPYHAIDRARVAADEQLFYVVVTASFIEITSDLYTRNLAQFYHHDDEVVAWLEQGWEQEEMQHGEALKRYVQAAWPDFDWEDAYRSFIAEFTQFCSVDQLAPTRALEMAARCVVETGTATFYRTLADVVEEPVLRQLASHIASDEVRHYKHFYRYYTNYREREKPGRIAVMRTLWNRIGEVDAEDVFYAFKHVYLAKHPGAAFRKEDYEAFRRTFRQTAMNQFPYGMAMKMLLKPLGLNAMLGRAVVTVMTAATRRFLFR